MFIRKRVPDICFMSCILIKEMYVLFYYICLYCHVIVVPN